MRTASDLTKILESVNPSNTYANWDEEVVKREPIIEPVHADNETEEDGHFSDTFISDIGKVCNLISPIANVTDAWHHVKSSRRNHGGWKYVLALYDHFGGKTTWITFRILHK